MDFVVYLYFIYTSMVRKILIAGLVLTSIVHLLFGLYGFPVLTSDTECFLPASFDLRLGNGLVNSLYNAGVTPDSRFLFYPPVFPFAVSLLLVYPSGIWLYGAITLLNVLGIVFTSIAVVKFIDKHNNSRRNLYNIAFIVALLLAASTFFTPGNSRPELLGRLILAALLLGYSPLKPIYWFFAGVGVALGGLTAPALGIYLLVLAVVIVPKAAVNGRNLLMFSSGGILVAISMLVFYPYRVMEMVESMQLHSQNVIQARDNEFGLYYFLRYHLFSTSASFGFVTFMFSAFVLLWHVFASTKGRERMVRIMSFLFLMVLVYMFGFRVMPMAYNIYVLAPLFLFACGWAFVKTSKNYLKVAVIVILLLNSVSFIRYSVVFAASAGSHEFSLIGVSRSLKKYTDRNGATIGVSNGLWPIVYGNSKADIVITNKNNIDGCDVVIIQQYGSGLYEPVAVEGFTIVENHFQPDPITLTGIKVGSYLPFYQYAVYERNQPRVK